MRDLVLPRWNVSSLAYSYFGCSISIECGFITMEWACIKLIQEFIQEWDRFLFLRVAQVA